MTIRLVRPAELAGSLELFFRTVLEIKNVTATCTSLSYVQHSRLFTVELLRENSSPLLVSTNRQQDQRRWLVEAEFISAQGQRLRIEDLACVYRYVWWCVKKNVVYRMYIASRPSFGLAGDSWPRTNNGLGLMLDGLDVFWSASRSRNALNKGCRRHVQETRLLLFRQHL